MKVYYLCTYIQICKCDDKCKVSTEKDEDFQGLQILQVVVCEYDLL